jgi:hypothetical protein
VPRPGQPMAVPRMRFKEARTQGGFVTCCDLTRRLARTLSRCRPTALFPTAPRVR